MPSANDHYNEAVRLLDMAGDLQVAVNVHPDRHLTPEAAQQMKDKLAEFGLTNVVIMDGAAVDLSPILLSAQVHATLAQYLQTAGY